MDLESPTKVPNRQNDSNYCGGDYNDPRTLAVNLRGSGPEFSFCSRPRVLRGYPDNNTKFNSKEIKREVCLGNGQGE